jgi:hypothetical protein
MAGKENSYGHPSTDTLAVLGGAGVNVLGTDVNEVLAYAHYICPSFTVIKLCHILGMEINLVKT